MFFWPKLCILHAFHSTYYPQKPAGGQRGPNPSSSAWPSSEPAHKNGALSLPLLSPPPLTPPPFPKPTKKSAPLNSTATPRSLTGEANLRGALCFRLRNTLAIHMRLTVWRCGSQKNNNKNKHYEIWSVAWNLILVKCLLSERMEYGSVANDSSNILKGRPFHHQIDGQADQ